jgi:GTPase SAR1 family protein
MNFKKANTVKYRTSMDFDRSRFSDNNNISLMDRTIYRFKLILLGDIAVGKTSILTRYVEDSYSNEYKCNVGVEFRVKSLFIDENIGADLQIWDTSGEEKYRVITRQYYRDKNGK